jgi:predicted dehydrogenase
VSRIAWTEVPLAGFLHVHPSQPLPDLGAVDVLVVDHRPEAVDAIGDLACRGGRVLLCTPVAPLGSASGEAFGRGEWFATLAAAHPAAARLDREFAITAALTELEPSPGDEVVVTASVRFRHRPLVTVRPMGAGAVITCGLGPAEVALAHPELGRLLERLLRPSALLTPALGVGPLGVGVIGYGPYGGMGYSHGLAVSETEGLAFTAVCDLSTERLTAARSDFPDVSIHQEASALAEDPTVDIAVVATAPSLHARLARELLAAGKHVVVEKPMCLTVAEADELLAAAAAADRTLTVHQSRRWDGDYRALRRLIQQGALGDVFNIETFVGGFDHPCRAWHSEESVSGGAVYDWGSHHLDWILQLYGSAPARVLTTTHKRVWRDVSNVDQVAVHLQWADGREATFRQSDVAAIRRPKFYLQGTEGTVEGWYRPVRQERLEPGRGYVGEWSHHAEAPVDLRLVRYEGNGELVERLVGPWVDRPWGFHRNLADHLLLGEPLAVDPRESRAVVAVLEAAHTNPSGELVSL